MNAQTAIERILYILSIIGAAAMIILIAYKLTGHSPTTLDVVLGLQITTVATVLGFIYRFGKFEGKTRTDAEYIKRDVHGLKTDVSSLKTDVGSLKTDVSSLKTDVGSLKTDVSNLKTDVSSLKIDVRDIKIIVGRKSFAQ